MMGRNMNKQERQNRVFLFLVEFSDHLLFNKSRQLHTIVTKLLLFGSSQPLSSLFFISLLGSFDDPNG